MIAHFNLGNEEYKNKTIFYISFFIAFTKSTKKAHFRRHKSENSKRQIALTVISFNRLKKVGRKAIAYAQAKRSHTATIQHLRHRIKRVIFRI